MGVMAPRLNGRISFPELRVSSVVCANPCMVSDDENFRCSAVIPKISSALLLFSVETFFVTSFSLTGSTGGQALFVSSNAFPLNLHM